MRISDWSSDVCSSDLGDHEHGGDDDRRFAGEARQRLVAVEHAGHHQREQDQHRADVDEHALADEQVQSAGEDQQEEDLVHGHRCILPANAFTLSTPRRDAALIPSPQRSEEHTSELQSLMRISYAVFCLKKKNKKNNNRQARQKTTETTHMRQYKHKRATEKALLQ